MLDPLLTPELLQTGARYDRERAPDPVTLGWLEESCARLERVLRLQYEEGKLPEEWERDLGMLGPVQDTTGGLRRWALLKHFYRVRWKGLEARAEAQDEGAAAAARALLRREPITIQIAGETVQVTGRSYSAMMEIAAHDLRIRELEEAIVRLERLRRRVSVQIAALPLLGAWGRRRALGRRLARLRADFVRLSTERERNRRAIYAHAMTPHGGPASSAEDAPSWWRRTGPMDDAELLGALFLAGPARIAQLPEPKAKDEDEKKGDAFGWASLFTFFERKHGMIPGRGWDTDLGQVLADIRAGNAPYDDLEG